MNPFEGRSAEEIGTDFFSTFYSGGMHGAYNAGKAIHAEDEDELYYMIAIEALVAGSIYGTIQILNYVQGPRYAMTFFSTHEGMGVARSILTRGVAPYALATTAGYGIGAIVGTALMAPFGKAKEAIRLYSNPAFFFEEAILGLPGNVKKILSHYL